jgi:hypothetical protein
MARIRSVKPEHWNDKELPNISLQAHLLWIGMWNFSDDDGILEADPLLIRSQVFPRRTDIRTEQMDQWLGQLVKARFVIPFEYNGSGYYIHRTFKAHQKMDKRKPSKIPKDFYDNVLRHFQEPETTRPLPIHDSSPTPPRPVALGEESKGEYPERRGEENPLAQNDESGLIWDIEKYLHEHQIDFESVCVSAHKGKEEVLLVLQKFHLWNQEKENYPKLPLPLIAGLKKWLLNEKSFTNGSHQQGNGNGSPKLGTSAARIDTAKKW